MSKKTIPQFGVVVEAERLVDTIKGGRVLAFMELVENGNCFELENFCRDESNLINKDIPKPISFFIPNSDYDLCDSMKEGKMYALFNEKDIYERKLTKNGKALDRLLISLPRRAWAVSG